MGIAGSGIVADTTTDVTRIEEAETSIAITGAALMATDIMIGMRNAGRPHTAITPNTRRTVGDHAHESVTATEFSVEQCGDAMTRGFKAN